MTSYHDLNELSSIWCCDFFIVFIFWRKMISFAHAMAYVASVQNIIVNNVCWWSDPVVADIYYTATTLEKMYKDSRSDTVRNHFSELVNLLRNKIQNNIGNVPNARVRHLLSELERQYAQAHDKDSEEVSFIEHAERPLVSVDTEDEGEEEEDDDDDDDDEGEMSEVEKEELEDVHEEEQDEDDEMQNESSSEEDEESEDVVCEVSGSHQHHPLNITRGGKQQVILHARNSVLHFH